MKRHAYRVTAVGRQNHQTSGLFRLTTKLATEGPVGAAPITQHPAEHGGTGGVLSELGQFLLRVKGEETHALLVSPGDIARLLDGVAERDA